MMPRTRARDYLLLDNSKTIVTRSRGHHNNEETQNIQIKKRARKTANLVEANKKRKGKSNDTLSDKENQNENDEKETGKRGRKRKTKSKKENILNIDKTLYNEFLPNDSISDKPSSTMLDHLIEHERSKFATGRIPLSNIRISGIEELHVDGNESIAFSIKREDTFVIDKTDPDTKKNVFAPASPCKLFKSFDKSTIMKTPEPSFCRSISVGSAGRTPIPPRKKSPIVEPVTTPDCKPRSLNTTHSVEKPVISQQIMSNSVKGKKSKITFVSPNSSPLTTSNKKTITISSLKNSNKIATNNKVEKSTIMKPRMNGIEKKKSKIISKIPRKAKIHISEAKGKQIANIIQSACNITPHKISVGKMIQPMSRGKMPNFASLHKKQFDQMESLVQFKVRKEERAKHLLAVTPNTKVIKSSETSSKKQPSIVTRFGFKSDLDNFKNLPAVTYKDTPRPKTPFKSTNRSMMSEAAPNEITSSTIKRGLFENQNYIVGVRTNRRFELQMKARNIIK